LLLPVLHVNETKGGYFSVFDKVHFIDRQKQVVVSADVSPKGKNKCPKTKVVEEETEDLNRLWLVIRYMKSCSSGSENTLNKFTLRGGERIKVGRVIFTVKELVNPHSQYNDA